MVHPGAYRGNKRQKELKRLQKQEEKRQKRLQKKTGGLEEPGVSPDEMAPPPDASDAGTPATEVADEEDGQKPE